MNKREKTGAGVPRRCTAQFPDPGYFDNWICADCSVEIYGDTMYMVTDAVWLSVMESKNGHLCLLCLEHRLGRELDPWSDFTSAPIDDDIDGRLEWMYEQGREALLELSRERRARLDRRAELRRARIQRKRALESHQHQSKPSAPGTEP